MMISFAYSSYAGLLHGHRKLMSRILLPEYLQGLLCHLEVELATIVSRRCSSAPFCMEATSYRVLRSGEQGLRHIQAICHCAALLEKHVLGMQGRHQRQRQHPLPHTLSSSQPCHTSFGLRSHSLTT